MSGPLSVVEAEQLLGDILLDAEATSERHGTARVTRKRLELLSQTPPP